MTFYVEIRDLLGYNDSKKAMKVANKAGGNVCGFKIFLINGS